MKIDILKGPNGDTQYQNLIYLANGGMSDIYTAKDTINDQPVAIKVIRITNNDKLLLEEEFKIASSLCHENIIKTYHFDEFADTTGNYFYSAIKLCSLGSLRNKIDNTQQVFSLTDCLNYFYDLLKGLQEAHKYIVHRDLKPENILIGEDGKLKICDFGIAKYVDHITRTKTFKGWGTYPYMSPDCWVHDANTKQMDIYSLGIIFFEILTSQQPFKGPTEREFRDQHLFNNLPSLPDLRKDIPVTISEIIRKMTNKNINERYKDTNEVIAAFDKVVETTKSNSLGIHSILKNVHRKINATAEAALKAQQEQAEYNQKQKVLNYSIEQLFNQFSLVSDSVNNELIDEKISYREFIVQTNAAAST